MPKLAYTPKEAAAEAAVPLDLIKDSIRTRRLPALDAEGKPIVLHIELETWLMTLNVWDS